jgi:phosphoribosyl 1,2-cyclic phosphodiesterase
MDPMHFPVGLQQLRGLQPLQELPADAGRIGDIVVETIELNHPGGCDGFKLRIGGTSIAYLPDHEPYPDCGATDAAIALARQKLIDFVHGVDLLILDTQYTADEYEKRIGWGHGCLTDSVRLALDAEAKRLMLFHHDPAHTDDEIDAMIHDARRHANGFDLIIEAAAEGQVLTLVAKPGGTTALSPLTAPASATPLSSPRLPAARPDPPTKLPISKISYAT